MTDSLIGKRVELLDKGWVELLDLMPHPAAGVSGDMAIVSAARVSFLGESKGDEKDKKLLFYLLRHQHSSPFEMVEFKFRVRAPLITYWQWVRHRPFHYQSANAQSGRYTEFEENDFYIPDAWRQQHANNKQASGDDLDPSVNAALKDKLIRHYEASYALYEEALAAGAAKEMARLFLPGFSVYYTWVIKVDALNLMHFLRLRMADDAQYEIRVYAQAIYREFFKPALPWTAEAFDLYWLGAGDG